MSLDEENKKKNDHTPANKGSRKSSLSKKELDKLKKDYKEGKLKFDSSDVADAIISQYKNSKKH